MTEYSILEHTRHELRTPLQPIIGYSEMLKNPKFSLSENEQREAAEEIHSNALRLSQVIEELFRLGKL